MMSAVKSKNTKLELVVRSALHRRGFRFRLHGSQLPGKPDLVFPGRRKVIFVNGCFWHAHTCVLVRLPKTNRTYWMPKLRANRNRDLANQRRLRRLGWASFTLWECQIRDVDRAIARAERFLRR
ncbi:MAG: very short patch repair endonuclease [Vicinamibacterales bacterium]